MADGIQYDPSLLSKDMEFRNAPVPKKIAYLSSIDPEFAAAPPEKQAGYINHLLGNDQETEFERKRAGAPTSTGEMVKRAALAPLTSDFWKQAGGAAKNLVGGLVNMPTSPAEAATAGAKTGIQIGQEDVARKRAGRSSLYRGVAGVGSALGVPAAQMEEQADVGKPEGVVGAAAPLAAAAVAPSVVKGVARATLPARTALAEKVVQPLVYEGVGEAGADTRFGIKPERGIIKEGIWGTGPSMVEQANTRLSLLKPTANNILQTAPGANTPLDATGAINSAVDDAITQAYKNGQGSIVPRLEELRNALHTKHGPTSGVPLDINNLKTSIQETASQLGAFKNTVPSEASAASAAGQASSNIRGQVNTAVPEAAPLNERMADVIDARAGLQRGIEAAKGKSVFGGGMEGMTSRVLNKTIGSPLVRSGAARLLSLGAKEPIPEMVPVPPPAPAPVPTPPPPAPYVPPPPATPVGGPPTLGFPATMPNTMWTGPAAPVTPTWETPGVSVPSVAPGPQPTAVELPQTLTVAPQTLPPVPSSQGAPPPAASAAPPETPAASPVGGTQVPPTLPPVGEDAMEAARRGAPGISPTVKSVRRHFDRQRQKP